jgi:predicted AAA+ superfamily ATPase
MIRRNLAAALLEALSDSPVVLLNGARQTGKSTLAQALGGEGHPARYLTLDDATLLSAARSSPEAFVGGLGGPTVIDEVQRAPELFIALKAAVDRDRGPGKYLLTGSADVLVLPSLSESLAGRMEILTLWPLSQGEIEGVRDGFVDAVFGDAPLPPLTGSPLTRAELLDRVVAGGYPEAVARGAPRRRRAWFGSYVTTILQRDVRDIANIAGLAELPRLLALLATRAAALLNFSELSRESGIPQSTLKRYMALLEATFLIQPLPAWSGNLGKRLTRSPKLNLCDTGLMASLLGIVDAEGAAESTLLGNLLENFVVMELRKQIGWSAVQPRMYHLRTDTGQEVDVVLEDGAGHLVGVEVKASGSVGPRDFRHLAALAELAGKRFRRGLVLYTGTEAVSFGPKLHALPVSALWRLGST